ncbi:MAG: hypothetical protein WC473_02985 [Patescibacteria group bacterium]|jgi:hypothetical protein
MPLLDKIKEERVRNPYLKELIKHLKQMGALEVDPLIATPGTAQLFQDKWHHHSDHTDYEAHNDSGGPSHGDYCD